MGVLDFLGFFNTTAEVVKETVLDKDAQNKILESLDTLKMETEKQIHLQELQTATVPWVDGLHKMGRQITNYLTIIIVSVLMLNGIEITGPAAMILGGGNVAYQVIKGKGGK